MMDPGDLGFLLSFVVRGYLHRVILAGKGLFSCAPLAGMKKRPQHIV